MSRYSDAIYDDAPTLYWRLNERRTRRLKWYGPFQVLVFDGCLNLTYFGPRRAHRLTFAYTSQEVDRASADNR